MIYFIQSENGGPIKIGYANNIQSRLEQLQAMNPYKLVCLAAIEGEIFFEQRLHHKFNKYRLHGEWFEPSEELLELVRNIDDLDRRLFRLSRKISSFLST